MNAEMLDTAYAEIEDFRDKLGEMFYDEFMEADNSTYEIGKSIIATFVCCKTPEEFKVADSMLTAICGWSFETLVEKIKARDAEDCAWESC